MMRRFYKQVTVAQPDTNQAEPVFQICLDGRPVKLVDSRAVLSVSSDALAHAIAEEWNAQGEHIIPDTMPLMQIVSTCIDKVRVQRAAMQDQLMKYVDTDLLFYRTDKPEDLRALQEKAWNPVLKDFEAFCGVTPLVTTDLVALSQPQPLHDSVRRYIESLGDEAFTVLQIAVPASGSIITGIFFTQGRLTPQQVLEIARVEERHKDIIYNAEKYGEDPSIEKADKALLRDLTACRAYLELLSAK